MELHPDLFGGQTPIIVGNGWDEEPTDLDGDGECCQACLGEGTVVTCFDDICVGQGWCMHGDGEDACPEYGGAG